ncbi:MAG: tRNA threonylcarbamoyladenosine dehydratase [Clostridium sp.]|nr:tRNA threonylcarbamoyladenosine dehydratase [Clostridium sp.]
MDFSRNELIWGKANQKKLEKKHVTIFGLGGVGGFALESLARAGVCNFKIVDFDKVSESNINRQIIALSSTIGSKKTELFKKRLLDINPEIAVECIDDFYHENLQNSIFNTHTDFVIDAIDTMRSKISLLEFCLKNNIPVITSMGAGNRVDPTQLYITDISGIENKKCTFTKNVLYQLKKRGIESGITAVCSRETPHVEEKISVTENITTKNGDNFEFTKITPGSTPFVPAVAGYYMGWYVLDKLLKN